MRKKVRKMMRKIAVMRKMMRKMMRKIVFMHKFMRKVGISSIEGVYSSTCKQMAKGWQILEKLVCPKSGEATSRYCNE